MSESAHEPLNRRQFAKSLAVGSAIPIATIATTVADEKKSEESEKPKKEGDMPKHSADDGAPDEKPNPLELNEYDLLLGVVARKYGNEAFTEEILKGIRRDIMIDGFRARVLGNFPLKNSDEPGFVFAAYRAED